MHAQQAPPSLMDPQEAGKDVTISADSQQMDKGTYHWRGHVRVVYKDVRMTANEASFDDASGEVIARGDVVFDDSQSHLSAEEVH